MIRKITTYCTVAGACLISGGLQAQDATRAISELSGDVYRFQENGHFSVFMVTDEGIIVTDPISPEGAQWLSAELDERFDQPVKYVIYSHDHWDHVRGAAAFPDAVIISHANAVPHIEASDQPIEPPDLTFTESMQVRLGDQAVELFYLGESHSDNLIYMHFPEEKILFGVDSFGVDEIPYQDFPGADINGIIDSLKQLEQMDVEIVAPGHGAVGTLDDVRAHREYIETLRQEVGSRLEQGMDMEQIKAEVSLPEYSDWASYEAWQPLNVEGMVRYLQAQDGAGDSASAQGQDMSGSFEGWRQIGDANWRVEDGVFVADAGSGHLVTEKEYEDFRISLEFWVDEGANSGVFFRASEPDEIVDSNAYEANIFDSRPDQTYRTGGVVHHAAPDVSINTSGRWNTYEITVEGDEITVKLNGVTTVELEDDTYDSGPIALQYGAGTVKFRNVNIEEL